MSVTRWIACIAVGFSIGYGLCEAGFASAGVAAGGVIVAVALALWMAASPDVCQLPPATCWSIRRAQRQNRADLRAMRGK